MTIRKLNANTLAADIRGGLDDTALMDKYGLSASQLQIAVGKLLQAHLIAESNLSGNLNHRTIATESPHPIPAVPQAHDNSQNSQANVHIAGCARTGSETECSHCGIIFSKVEQIRPSMEPNRIAPGSLDPEMQTGTYHDLIAGIFYEEAAEVQEKKRKKKLWAIRYRSGFRSNTHPLCSLGLQQADYAGLYSRLRSLCLALLCGCRLLCVAAESALWPPVHRIFSGGNPVRHSQLEHFICRQAIAEIVARPHDSTDGNPLSCKIWASKNISLRLTWPYDQTIWPVSVTGCPSLLLLLLVPELQILETACQFLGFPCVRGKRGYNC